jgi:hypothetical protein
MIRERATTFVDAADRLDFVFRETSEPSSTRPPRRSSWNARKRARWPRATSPRVVERSTSRGRSPAIEERVVAWLAERGRECRSRTSRRRRASRSPGERRAPVSTTSSRSSAKRIYSKRGLDKELSLKVAEQLSAYDRLGAHLRDELGIDPLALAQPRQAAWISAVSFSTFALLPIVALLASPARWHIAAIAAGSLGSLAVLGALGAYLGGARMVPATLRVTLGGGLAMAMTAVVGRLLGAIVG